MTSMTRGILGVSFISTVLAFAAGCDGGTDAATGGTGGLGATGGTGTGATTSTGSTTGTGAAAGTGGTTGSSGCAITDGAGTFTRNEDTEFVSGTGHGYGFAYISAGTSTNCTGKPSDTATGICAAGTVPLDATYSAVAGIGVNVNQDGELSPPIAGTFSSIGVSYANNGTSILRVQVVQDDGSTNGKAFCYELKNAETSATVTTAQLVERCWTDTNGPGSSWDGTKLRSIQLITPSKADATTPFDACLNGYTLTAAAL